MAQTTEAACLLEAGALYSKRVLLIPAEGAPVFAGLKQGAFSLYFGDAPIYHFDLEGRWQRAYIDGLHELNGLDNVVRSIDRIREGENLVLHRRTRPEAEADALNEVVRSTAARLLADLDAGAFRREDPPDSRSRPQPLSTGELRGWLATIMGWDRDAWRAHRDLYRSTYGPWPLLPPDCLNAVVLQAAPGGADGRRFGAADATRARDVAEFEGHADAVRRLYGRRIEQCRNVFLDGPEVLRLPVDHVAGYLDAIRRRFPIDPQAGRRGTGRAADEPHRLDGIHAFLDRFDPPLPGADDLRRLNAQGLSRLSILVESGDPAVRASYGKSWSDDSLRAFVAEVKGAGIGVGVLTLVGAGGIEADDRHARATGALLGTLPLGKGDLVSLLDANELLPLGPARPPEHAAPAPLLGEAWAAQLDALKRLLGPLRIDRQVKIAPYSLEKQAGI